MIREDDEREDRDRVLERRQKKANEKREAVEGKPTYKDDEVYESD